MRSIVWCHPSMVKEYQQKGYTKYKFSHGMWEMIRVKGLSTREITHV